MRTPRGNRMGGYTLVELLVVMVLTAIIGVSLLRILLVQSGFANQQDAVRSARSVSKGAVNLLLTELRMVETSGGVVSATPGAVQLRVPYGFGVICGSSGGVTTASLLPTDSSTMASAGFSGYAWRNASGTYTYETASPTMSAGNAAVCAADSIRTLTGGRVVDLTPAVTVPAGTPVFLFQTLQYEFRTSGAIPNALGLWRTASATGRTDEIAAPFDSLSSFRFRVRDSDTAQATPPATLSDLRGLEFVLTGVTENVPQGDSLPAAFDLTATVFFRNRGD